MMQKQAACGALQQSGSQSVDGCAARLLLSTWLSAARSLPAPTHEVLKQGTTAPFCGVQLTLDRAGPLPTPVALAAGALCALVDRIKLDTSNVIDCQPEAPKPQVGGVLSPIGSGLRGLRASASPGTPLRL